MTFHRLVAPTYLGGLPVGYDYINNPPLNGDPGAASAADGKKGSGPNQGTYFVAFGEDATSNDANRSNKALAQNTDYLDDLFHRDLALTARTVDVTAGGPVASLVIAGDVFVGALGTANTQEQRNRLISVLDSSDNEVVDASGTKVVCTLIHNGSSTNVLGTQTSGFYTGPTINFTPSIPTGTVYRIYYGERTNLAALPVDAFTDIIIRGAEEVDGSTQKLFKDLHGGTQAWNDPWDSTIRALASSGLNERYRRQTTVPGSFTYNTPGNGATIIRDGIAPRVTSVSGTPNGWDDPVNAFWVSVAGGSRGTGATPNGRSAASTGFVSYVSKKSTKGASTNEDGAVLSAAAFLSLWPHDFSGNVANAKTQITPTRAATKRPSATGSNTSEILLHASDFAHNGTTTAIAPLLDLIEVTRASGKVETYYIKDINQANPRLLSISNLGGGDPSSSDAVDETVYVKWVSTLYAQGGGASNYFEDAVDGVGMRWDSFIAVAPPILTTVNANEAISVRGHRFYSSACKKGIVGTQATLCMEFGGRDDVVGGLLSSGRVTTTSKIWGDGKAQYTQLKITEKAVTVTATGTTTWNPREQGAQLNLIFDQPSNTQVTATLALDSDYIPEAGDMLVIYITQDNSVNGLGSMVWPGSFVFSGNDATPSQGSNNVTKYIGSYVGTHNKFFFSKVDYDL